VFHHHSKESTDSPIVSPPVHSVRLLKNPEELQAAVERAQAFERRRADDYQRRVGAYDRFLATTVTKSAVVVPIEASAS
jgi:hypothetical protein